MEIRLERKRRRRGWAWLVILIAPVAYLAYFSRERRTASAGEIAELDSTASFVIPRDTARGPDWVAELADFVARADTSADERRQREYVANALALLANAVTTMRGADAPFIATGVANMRGYAERLRGPRGRFLAQSDSLRANFLAAASVLDTLERNSYPSSTDVVAPVRAAARGLQTGQAFVAQGQVVSRFFKQASDALLAMRARRE